MVHLMLTTDLKRKSAVLIESQIFAKLLNSCGMGALALPVVAGRSQARMCRILVVFCLVSMAPTSPSCSVWRGRKMWLLVLVKQFPCASFLSHCPMAGFKYGDNLVVE